MELKTIKDAFDHVTKKQKLCSSKTQEAVEQITKEIYQAIAKLQSADASAVSSNPDVNSVLTELKTKVREVATLSQLEGTQKEVNASLSKYTKLLEKSFNPDISKAYRNVDFDPQTINKIIASHLYRQGLFEAGDCFSNEIGDDDLDSASMKSSFTEMYLILEAMKSHNLDPALHWALTNRDKLKGCHLELKLHSLKYLEILQNEGLDQALKYARTHLSPFADSHMCEIQKLMACLIYAGRLDTSPYADLLSPTNWDKLASEFSRHFCNLLGESLESPLSVTVGAGVQGLPTLLKLMSVMTAKRQEWQAMKQLPVPVDLDREYQFHTIFVCPVSRDQATEENPAMLMSCGHVLCKQSIMKLSKNLTKCFKCPYCPSEIDGHHCKQLIF